MISPSSSRPGDFMCVFANLTCPFILRARDNESRRISRILAMLPESAREWTLVRILLPSEGCWTMIGEDYVHGIMDREVAEETEMGERVVQKFEIR